MPARATRLKHHGLMTGVPPAPGVPCAVEVINLDGFETLKVTQGGYAVGYFATPQDAERAGVDLSTAQIKGDTR